MGWLICELEYKLSHSLENPCPCSILNNRNALFGIVTCPSFYRKEPNIDSCVFRCVSQIVCFDQWWWYSRLHECARNGALRVRVVWSKCEIQVIGWFRCCSNLLIHNTLDMMHLEHNVTENVLQIILGEKDIAGIEENMRELEIRWTLGLHESLHILKGS